MGPGANSEAKVSSNSDLSGMDQEDLVRQITERVMAALSQNETVA
jgi:xanthine dehydrogenase molybdopterin-binding subunit B